MKCIVAVDEQWGIGKNNGLLFRISEDLRRFRALTEGNTVVMGRKTLLTLPGGKPLKNRRNIVLSRDPAFPAEGAAVCTGIEELHVLLARPEYSGKETYVIGGAEVYRLLLPYCGEALVTHIHAKAEADAFFPDLSKEPGWQLAVMQPPGEDAGLSYHYSVYRRS